MNKPKNPATLLSRTRTTIAINIQCIFNFINQIKLIQSEKIYIKHNHHFREDFLI